jgi:hypothetical protein
VGSLTAAFGSITSGFHVHYKGRMRGLSVSRLAGAVSCIVEFFGALVSHGAVGLDMC